MCFYIFKYKNKIVIHYFWAENLWEHVQNIVYSQVLSSQIQFVIKFNVNRFFFFKTQKVVEEILDRYNFFFNEMNLYNALYLFCIIVILILYFIFIRGWQLVILKNLNCRLNFRDFLKYSCNLKKIFNGYNVNL